jgi:hypothetical protein
MQALIGMAPALQTVGTIAGTALSAVSAIQQGQAASAAAKYQQQVALRNQQIQEQNARQVMENTQVQQMDWGDEARLQLGQLVGELAASGVALEGGSAGLLRRGARRLAQRDAQRIQIEGNTAARGLRQQGADFGAQANFAGMEARSARTAGALGALSSFIGGATQWAGNQNTLLRARA